MTVTIIGYGNVGRVLATLLLGSGHEMNLNIMDPADDLSGAFLDLEHSMGMQPGKRLYFNDTDRMEESDYVFFTAGIPSDHGASRLTTVADNTRLVKEIFSKRKLKPTMRIIAITNPVDVVTAALIKYTGLPWNQVVGTGTFLDSERFSYFLAQHAGVDYREVGALILGEHGESFAPILSHSTFQGRQLEDHRYFKTEMIEKAIFQTHHAAFEIRKTEPGTSMAVSHCALRIMEYWMRDEEAYLPISVLVGEDHVKWLKLEQTICMSLPVYISSKGIRREQPLDLTPEEFDDLKASAHLLQKYQSFMHD